MGDKRWSRRRIFGILLLMAVLFHWKTLLTHQYSLLADGEAVNQAYSWYNFAVGQIKQGTLPLWDPYTQSGRIFSGEMQTGAFYPLNFILALVPFNHSGLFSPQAYHWMYVLTQVLAAWFMACLALELGLGSFAGIVSGLCFAYTGFVWRAANWPHLFQSAIWLPPMVLFLLRALKAGRTRRALLNASLCGCCLGLSTLAGGLHIVVMQGIVVATVIPYYCRREAKDRSAASETGWRWARRAAPLVVTAVIVGVLAGGVQLLPSMEYSQRAIRWYGPGALPATERIPYAHMDDGFWPHGLLQIAFFMPFQGQVAPGGGANPYAGVFPVVLAVIGIWKYRRNTLARYLAGLAAFACLYSLAGMSLLHGIMYAVTPFLSAAREADRFLYLANFAIAVLAGFGAEALVARASDRAAWEPMLRVFRWVALGAFVALAIPAVYGRPEINLLISFSLGLIISSFFLFRYLAGRPAGAWGRFLVVAIILFDFYAFDWTAANKIREAAKGSDHLERLLGAAKAAKFLKSRPGAYRSEVIDNSAPNIGNLYGVETTGGAAVSMVQDYSRARGNADLLATRYTMRPASSQEPGNIVYQDAAWKIYERPTAFPRAWLVHDVVVERDPDELFRRLEDSQIDLRRTALVGEPLDAKLDPAAEGADSVDLRKHGGNSLELNVNAGSRGLLVLSEVFYPGWKATVNGRPARIWKVNGALRGIVVPPGRSRVEMHYAPMSVYVGGVLTLVTFIGVLAAALLLRRTRETKRAAAAAAL